MNKNTILKISVLSISIALTSTGSVAMLIPALLNAYPNENTAVIESIVTLSSLSTFVAILLNDFIVRKIGYRKTVLLGILLTLVGGIGPRFVEAFDLILTMRIILGIGLGLCNPIAVSLINIFFKTDKERATLLGLQNSVSGLGLTLMTFLAGILSVGNWKNSFWIYLIMVPVLLLIYFFVPEPQSEEPKEKVTTVKKKEKVQPIIYLFALIIFVFFVFYFTVSLKTASLIVTKGFGSTLTAGNILSIRSITVMIGAALFGLIYRFTQKYTLILAFISVSLACFSLYFSNSLIMVGIGVTLGGFAVAILIPYIYILVGRHAKNGTENMSVSLIQVGSNAGIFLSPYIVNFIPSILGKENVVFPFFVAGSVFVVISLVSILINITKALPLKKKIEENSQ